jgi:FtsP/CotA-like multicopper oxidase with cupredoxin domain
MLDRREFLKYSGAIGAAAALPSATRARAAPVREFLLRPAPAVLPVVGKPYPDTPVWSYGARLPGPPIRVRQGEPVRVVLENALDAQTTVHWHGIRLPNAMDGVPGLTQAPVEPGQRFVYEFTPPDAGTFWYHPHVRAFEQVDRGLSGALIVEEAEPPEVDRDEIWLLDDWRLTREATIREDFGAGHDLSHAGRIGNTVTINGRIRREIPVSGGERIRLRLINACNARGFALSFTGHAPVVIAIDGQPVTPHAPQGGVVTLGAAMRVDLILDLTGEPGARFAVNDSYFSRRPYTLTELVYDERRAGRGHVGEDITPLPSNPLIDPDPGTAVRHEVALEGGAMGGLRGARLDGEWQDMRTLVRSGLMWALQGVTRRPGDHGTPMIEAPLGSSQVITLRNRSAFPHPMHLHGHHFRVLARNGASTLYAPWQDTVLVMPRESVEIGFVADNPGNWLFHCHVLEHHAAGMSAVVKVG